jgi:uncharacterized protein (DUF2336 family)
LDPRELLAIAQDASTGGRKKLATAVSQFFEEKKLTETEMAIAGEIMMNLIRQATTDLREALAERLAVIDNVPADLIVFLANDQISVAEKVLLNSPVLSDVDLVCIISSQGHDHWRTIAKRGSISPIVVDRLIDTRDTSTVLNLIDNQRLHLQKPSIKKLVKVSLRSEELQAPLLRRPEIDSETAVDLYMVVAENLREEIAKRFQIPDGVLEQSVEDLLQELSNEARGTTQTTPDMLALAKRFAANGTLDMEMMIKTLRRGQLGFFIGLVSVRSGFEPKDILRMIQKDGGKGFVVTCRALGMQKSDFASIFLLSRGIRSGDKIVDQRELALALKNFESIKEADAHHIVAAWKKNPELI